MNIIFIDKSNNINSIIELSNKILIISNDNSQIQLWKKKILHGKYKCIHNYIYIKDIEKDDKSFLFKIKNDSFIFNSFKKNTLSFFNINNYEKIQLKTELKNIKIIKGNTPIIKYPNEDYLLLSCVEYDNSEEIEEENNNNAYDDLYFNYKRDFSIMIIDTNNFNVIGRIKNNYPFIDMKYYLGNTFVALDMYGVIHKIEFDKYKQKLFLIDKINFNNDLRLDNNKITGFNLTGNRNSAILYLSNKIIIISNYE